MLPLRRWRIGIAAVAGLALLFYFFPLFHIVPLKTVQQQTSQSLFDPVAFVDRFWNDQLIPAADRAVSASEVVEWIRSDPKGVRAKYGRQVGLGSSYYLFVSGRGRVDSSDKSSLEISLNDGSEPAKIRIITGNIFGNAVRDGTGLIDINDIPNSQDFNAVSSEINHRIEQNVLPPLRQKELIGKAIRFVGCAEIVDENTDLQPLRLVPIIVEVGPP